MPFSARLLPAVVAVSHLLMAVACGGERGGGDDIMRVEDLGEEVLYVHGEAGPLQSLEGGTEGFLDLFAFDPAYPRDLPDGYQLSAASVVLESAPPGGASEKPPVSLALHYTRKTGGPDLFALSQIGGPMGETVGATTESVEIGDVEGVLVRYAEMPGFLLMWHTCDRTFAVQSEDIEESEAIRVAESVQCPNAEKG